MNKGLKLLLMSLLIVGMSCGVAMAAAPESVSGLGTDGIGEDWVLWSWTNPSTDFDHVEIYINDVFELNETGNSYNDTGLTPSTLYTISTRTSDASGNVNATWVNLSVTTNSPVDTEAPESVSGLGTDGIGEDWVLWSWTNPSTDFDHVEIYVNDVFELNTTANSYNDTGLTPSTSYTISTRTSDGSGNVNSTWVNLSVSTNGPADNEAPESVTGLDGTPSDRWILWEWTNPSTDFDHVEIYINDVFELNTTANSYNDTGLTPSTPYTISTRTSDSSGNVNSTWVNYTLTTSSDSSGPGPVEDLSASESNIGSTWIKWTWTDPADSDFDYVKIYIDDVFETNVSKGTEYYNATGLDSETEYTIKVRTVDTSNNEGSDETDKASTVSLTYFSGDRIWDKDENQSTTYTWDFRSFSGFYYDLDTDEGSESMTIKDIGKNIDKGYLTYLTEAFETDFENNNRWNKYEVIGFMAEKYFAGYPADAFNTNTDRVSLMSEGMLSKVLIDDDDKKSVYTGAGLVLEDGYVLNIIEVDINGDRVYVKLSKDGDEVDEGILSSGSTYIYEKDLGDVDDVPIIAVYFKEIFSGIETNAVFVEGMFQISDEYLEIDEGDDFGDMTIDNIGPDSIEMENDRDISLGKGDIVDIMGKLKIIVADSGTLRFAPFVDMSEPGTYELRGTVVENGGFKWTPLNFEGFYYNIDEGIGTESLEVLGLTGSKIEEGNLTYTTRPDNVSFEYSDWGEYEVIGFMAEKYFAGYPDDAFEPGFDDVSLMSEGMLSKVLIDDDDKKSVYGGSSLILEEGYALDILEVDINGEKVFVELNKDGDRVDSTILSSGTPYIYDKDLGDAEDVPIIVINFDEIFSGRESTAVFVEGIFQISEDYLEIEEGDDFDEMTVSDINSNLIEMENEDDITLSDGDEIEIMGDIQFKVADSSDVRYYPFVEITVEPSEALDVEVDPKVVVEGDEITVTVLSRGSLINDATVKAGSIVLGTTDEEGVVEYKFFSDGTYTITAEKDGYATGTAELEVISPDDLSRKMSIELSPEVIYEGNLVTFTIVKAIGGEPMDDVRLSLDGKTIGQTGSDGVVTDVLTETGMHKLIAEKDGFLNAELNIEVKEMQAKFEFSDLVLDPIEVRSGKDVEITLNAVNNGNAEGSYTVELMVNNNVTDTQEISLGVNETTEVTFEYTSGEPGSYLVKVGGMTATLEVVEGVSTILYLLGGLAVAVLGGAAYLFTAGGWTIETAGPKASEAMAALSEKISNMLSRGKE
ncbi:S-layer protein domain-containing protein [Methanococcoides sp. NM1]|uniref:S-layer protein domain-containing protein n=1 Tax=Methanococcoides sp. NM1 TaxID=1201013 RepID=UPI0010827B18|nr:S-layer protein domain-containing protein [Methanococcoides sp. NM1]